MIVKSPIRKLLPALAATAALAAVAAPTAAAETPSTVWLNPNSGELSFTGTEVNDWEKVTKYVSPSTPGGYRLRVDIHNAESANFSANCEELGGPGEWVVTCPALQVKKLTFDGKAASDSFDNETSIPSEAHGGPGVEVFTGGSGADAFYGDGDTDHLHGNGGDDTLDGGAAVDDVTGGAGRDIASYADAKNVVNASLDDATNDGVPGETENIPSDIEDLEGGQFADKLYGNSGPNRLYGGDSPDDLDGYNGDDTLNGQAGNDTLHANKGADVLYGGTDNDTLSYAMATGRVTVYQDWKANDGLMNEGDDVNSIENLTGSQFGDDIQGTTGDDVIYGGKGSDKIDPLFGDDKVFGGGDSDNIMGGPGIPADCGNAGCTKFDTDTVDGGQGSDTVDYSSRSDNLTIAIDGSSKSGGFMENDTLTAMESVAGGSGDDTIRGNAEPNSLIGGPGNDGIEGFGGNDYIAGWSGNDVLLGEGDNDYVAGGDDNDMLIGLDGSDTLSGGNGRDRVSYWGAQSMVVAHIGTGTSGPGGEWDKIDGDVEELEGSDYGDQLYGNDANNTLIGHTGKDMLVGNGGVDTLEGDKGADKLYTNGDGVKDHSICGDNAKDEANADKIDLVDKDCEIVNK